MRLRGKVDRIDRIGDGFRVIDYKTGHAVKPADVHTHLRAVQLPLYALAVETHLHGEVDSCDFGYWNLGRDGFAPVKLKGGWPEFKGRVVEEVVRLVGELRSASFPVEPNEPRLPPILRVQDRLPGRADDRGGEGATRTGRLINRR